MKTKVITAALILFVTAFAAAQTSYQNPLRILSGFDHGGIIKWTNQIHTTWPVYEMLRASTVTGAWTHFFYITNQHSTPLTNAFGTSAGEIFHKVAWIGDTQTVFNYTFEEPQGFQSVTGQLSLSFTPGTNLGVWSCAETGQGTEHYHPTGSAVFAGGGIAVTPTNHAVRLLFNPLVGDTGVYLEGVMHQGMTNNKSIYTGFSGTVFENRFVGPVTIGTFTATRAP